MATEPLVKAVRLSCVRTPVPATPRFQSVRQLQAAIFQLPYQDTGRWKATTVNNNNNTKKGTDSNAEIVRTVQPLMADSRPLMGGWFGGWYWLSSQEITQWPRCREEVTSVIVSKGSAATKKDQANASESAESETVQNDKPVTKTVSTGWVWTDAKRESIRRKLQALALRGKGPLAKKADADDAGAAGKKKKRR